MRRQMRKDILVTKWDPEMNLGYSRWSEGCSKISVWLRKQMNKYDLSQADIARNNDISFGTLRHLLVYTKGRVTQNVAKRLALGLASAVHDKDYLEFLYEILEVTGQLELFPKDRLNELKSIIYRKE